MQLTYVVDLSLETKKAILTDLITQVNSRLEEINPNKGTDHYYYGSLSQVEHVENILREIKDLIRTM